MLIATISEKKSLGDIVTLFDNIVKGQCIVSRKFKVLMIFFAKIPGKNSIIILKTWAYIKTFFATSQEIFRSICQTYMCDKAYEEL